MDRAVDVRRRGDGVRLLHVIGNDDRRHGPLGERDPAGPIDEMANLGRLHRHLDEFTGDVLEQRVEVDLLLIVTAESRSSLLPDDRHDGLMVELGVVQPVQ